MSSMPHIFFIILILTISAINFVPIFKAQIIYEEYDFANGVSAGTGILLYDTDESYYSTIYGDMHAYTYVVSSVGGVASSIAMCLINKSFTPDLDKKYEIIFYYEILEESNVYINRFSPLTNTAYVGTTLGVKGSILKEREILKEDFIALHNYEIPGKGAETESLVDATLIVAAWYYRAVPVVATSLTFLPIAKSILALDDVQDIEIGNYQLKMDTPVLTKGETYDIEFMLYSELNSGSFIETSGGYNDIYIKLRRIQIQPLEVDLPEIRFDLVPDAYPVGDKIMISWIGESEDSTSLMYSFKLEAPCYYDSSKIEPEIGVNDWSDWSDINSIIYNIPKDSVYGTYTFQVKVRDEWGNEDGPIETTFNMLDFIIAPRVNNDFYFRGELAHINLEITNKGEHEAEVGIAPCFKDSMEMLWCDPMTGSPKYDLIIPSGDTKSIIITWTVPEDFTPGLCILGVLTFVEGETKANNLLSVPIFFVKEKIQESKAIFTYSPEEIISGEPVTFDASSFLAIGENVSCKWHFGDGSIETGTNVSHTYTSAGNYIVKLEVVYEEEGHNPKMGECILTVKNRGPNIKLEKFDNYVGYESFLGIPISWYADCTVILSNSGDEDGTAAVSIKDDCDNNLASFILEVPKHSTAIKTVRVGISIMTGNLYCNFKQINI